MNLISQNRDSACIYSPILSPPCLLQSSPSLPWCQFHWDSYLFPGLMQELPTWSSCHYLPILIHLPSCYRNRLQWESDYSTPLPKSLVSLSPKDKIQNLIFGHATPVRCGPALQPPVLTPSAPLSLTCEVDCLSSVLREIFVCSHDAYSKSYQH